ncbi:protein of unknown function [Myxococcus fulvus]|uniref:Rho termination factor N-terminal domain-containing protein n=1 Tax=Myxococcus fulvus TaxID=33 RepID=A0A511T756_MYXFU|nr:DUF4912 domain-containing protein [Myxococcus fulvus]GEN09433.1 hypothetical protein MFU01_44700 [Myxococcus fulvus]SEU32177.1 protein of unknown function [Myxococcus fulvus]
MDDLKSVTVGSLRELARKHLGSGYSKLKKEELIAALAAFVPALAKLARLAGIKIPGKKAAAKKAPAEKTPVPAKIATRPAPPVKAAAAKAPAPTSKTARPRAPAKAAPPAKAPASKGPAVSAKAKAPAARGGATKETPASKRVTGAAPVAKAPVESKPKPGRSRVEEPSEQGRVSAPKRVAAKRASEKPGGPPSARPAQVVNFPPKPRAPREPAQAEAEGSAPTPSEPTSSSAPSQAAPPGPAPVEQHRAEPVIEGFFVARVAGEGEARRHHLQEKVEHPPVSAERGEGHTAAQDALPSEYQDDTVLLLARDPNTLFALWDFSAATRTRAMRDLDSPRSVLRVFDGDALVRELDCVLETRGYYIHGLPSGRLYRIEAHFVGRDGRSRRIGGSSNRVAVPPAGVSTDTTVRFMRRPVPVEPEAPPVPKRQVPPVEEREYVTWHRVELPGSAGVKDIPVVHRERFGVEGVLPGESSGPHLAGIGRAPGASDQRYVASQRYLEAQARMAGASDMRYAEQPPLAPPAPRTLVYLEVGQPRAPGASDQRYQAPSVGRLEGARPPVEGPRPTYAYLEVGRAPGASDMRYIDAPGGTTPQASDRRYFESPTRAPGASDMRYFDVSAQVPGASGWRYLESPPRASGASDWAYGDAAGWQYLASPPRAMTSSDFMPLASPVVVSGPPHGDVSASRHVEVTSRALEASDLRYGDTSSRDGSDLHQGPAVSGASTPANSEAPRGTRELPGAVTPTSPESGYFEARSRETREPAPPQHDEPASVIPVSGFFDAPPGSSDARDRAASERVLEVRSPPTAVSNEPSHRKPPSGGGRS